MVKLTVLYVQPKDSAAFERYYLDTHTPIALKVKGLRRFEIARVVGTADGSPSPYHRIADLYSTMPRTCRNVSAPRRARQRRPTLRISPPAASPC